MAMPDIGRRSGQGSIPTPAEDPEPPANQPVKRAAACSPPSPFEGIERKANDGPGCEQHEERHNRPVDRSKPAPAKRTNERVQSVATCAPRVSKHLPTRTPSVRDRDPDDLETVATLLVTDRRPRV